jgi:CubicO group peptidase (beta-lactamase class C family)
MKKAPYSILPLLTGFFLLLASCGQQSEITKPEKVGLSGDTLALAAQKMQKYTDEGKMAGITTLVMKEGKIVQRERFGFANMETQEAMGDDHIFRIFSMTKPVTAVALMTLYDEGKFELDDPVSTYLPEFKYIEVYSSAGETPLLEEQVEEMTIRHLLTHTSGIIYGWGGSYVDSLYRASEVGSWESVLEDNMKILAGLPLKFQPGTAYEYGLSIDVAGYLVEVLSGLTLDAFFKTRIFDPLGMDDTGFYVTEEKHDRLAELYFRDEEGKLNPGGEWGERYKKPAVHFSGGGGLVSTMDDYLSFCTMLLNGGELNGTRILEESTAKLIMSDQLPPGVSFGEDSGYGLAGSVNLESGAYSWGGAASTNFWIDPSNEMIVITMSQLMPSDHSYANDYMDLVNRALMKE